MAPVCHSAPHSGHFRASGPALALRADEFSLAKLTGPSWCGELDTSEDGGSSMKSEKISFMMIAVLGVFGVSLLLCVHASAQTEVILHHFGGSKWDGTYPSSGVIFDADGNLYGETGSGGSRENGGTVYELSPRAGGGWMEQVLHNFDGNGGGGEEPNSGLIFDAGGNLYGTTGQGNYNFG